MHKSAAQPQTVIRFPVTAQFTIQTLGFVHYTSPWTHFARRSDDYIMFFVESGDLYIEEDGIRYHIGENQAILLEPGKLHRGYRAATVAYYFVHFTCSEPLTPGILTDELKEQIIQLHIIFLNSVFVNQWSPSPYDFADLHFPKLASLGVSYDYFRALQEAHRIFYESYEGRRTLISLRLQELLTMMCREFTQSCVHPGNTKALVLVRDIRLYLEQHYADPLTGRNIASAFHLDYDYANRLFKRHTGQSIHNCLIGIRIHRAQRLLSAGMKVGDAAQQVGIEDVAYFSRLFKKHTGMSPSQCAKAANTDRER